MKTLYEHLFQEDNSISVQSALFDSISEFLENTNLWAEYLVQTPVGAQNYGEYLSQNKYKLASYNFMTNLGLADQIIEDSGVKNYKGKYGILIIPVLLELFMKQVFERSAIMVIPLLISAEKDLECNRLIESFLPEEGNNEPDPVWQFAADISSSDVFWKKYARSVKLFERILRSETHLAEILNTRNVDKNGVSLPIVFRIDPMFLTLTLIH